MIPHDRPDHSGAPGSDAGSGTNAAERALSHVGALASGGPVERSLRITLNFHPDRVTRDGVPLLEQLLADGVYRSQFVTGTSNGGLTAHPGGDRWRWESRIFGGAYDAEAGEARPVYGALNVHRRSVGGSPRFGSTHLRLRAQTLDRATFCFPDSFYEPSTFGVGGAASVVIAAALGDGAPADPLDGYVETQVHGPVLLERDVEALVLDPCYRGTVVEAQARRLPVPLEWHTGFRLTVTELRRHPDYRGPEFVELGAAIAEDGLLDPRVIGDAVRTGRHDPQSLKRVWHYLACFGAPNDDGEGAVRRNGAKESGDPETRIRPARPEEAAALSELALRSKGYWGYDEAFLSSSREELTLRPADLAAHRTVVAEREGRLLGLATLVGTPPAGELGMLFVAPEAIGRGVGSALYRHVLATARELGFTRLELDADPNAEPFYRAMGAEVVGAAPSGSIPGRVLPRMAITVDA